MVTILISTTLSIFSVGISSWLIFNWKKNYKPEINSLNDLEECFVNDKTTKVEYKKLETTNANNKIKSIFKNLTKPMFTDKVLIKNKDYLLSISKFVDYKINNSKQTYRSKSNIILIEAVASILCSEIIKRGECNLFRKFEFCKHKFNLRQKEIKIFKLLIAKCLIDEIFNLEKELCEISGVIIKAKTAKHTTNYRKKLLNSANLYGIVKFNNNSTKLLFLKSHNKMKIIKNFFAELFEAENRLKIACTYLKVLFD